MSPFTSSRESSPSSEKNYVSHDDCFTFDEQWKQQYASKGAAPMPSSITHQTLSVIFASRQLYEEGSTIFWSSNSFVFTHAHSLPTFLDSLHPNQREKLRTIHLCVRRHVFGDYSNETHYQKMEMKTVDQLRSIHNLAVDFGFENPYDDVHVRDYQRAIAHFGNLMDLNPTRISVRVKDTTDIPKYDYHESQLRLTKIAELLLAQDFERGMRDPEMAVKREKKRLAKSAQRLHANELGVTKKPESTEQTQETSEALGRPSRLQRYWWDL